MSAYDFFLLAGCFLAIGACTAVAAIRINTSVRDDRFTEDCAAVTGLVDRRPIPEQRRAGDLS